MWSDEKMEWQEDVNEFGLGISNRMLGGNEYDYGEEVYGENDDIPLSYKILKYGIFTLYLILFVEFVRHTIDHAARGRPFFTAVLSMVYSELATLGIVEFGVFLIQKYTEFINKEMKQNFADVHFALFLTAIFNALQYSLTSIVSTRRSNGLWVKTEQLELDHYVEIREEYERVQEIIDLQYTGCGKWVRNCFLFVCRPGLRRRHESLRVQVRFHELRLHFLEFNNLSFSLKVSDYLKRSELSILIGLVHVSVATWVLLIGILNLGYFIFGMIGYYTANPGLIALLISLLFFVVVGFFIVLCLALRWKMHRIFQTVMKTKVIEASDHGEGIKNQKNLFWFGSPHLVISMIQLMNFGYAISFSIIIIYSQYLNKTQTGISVVMSVGCYIVFLYNLSALLPEYTLCTSLGYLTNQKELQETVATHRLEEAERQRRKKIIENATVSDTAIVQAYPVAKSGSIAQHSSSTSLASSVDGALPGNMDKKPPLLVSDLVKIDTKALRRNLPEESREILMNREERMRQRRLNRKKSVSDGVAAMRAWGHGGGPSISQEPEEISKRNHYRRSRIRRTTSQPGVIQGWRNITESEQERSKQHELDGKDGNEIGTAKIRRKSSSDPRTIQAWKESLQKDKEEENAEEKVLVSRKQDKESNEDLMPKWKKDRLNRLAARKRARKKTQSASAIIQSWQDESAREVATENEGAISDENYNSSDLRALSSDDGSDDNINTLKVKTGRFQGEKINHIAPLGRRQFNLRTLRENDDHWQVSEHSESDVGVISDEKVIVDLSDAVIVENRKLCKDKDENTADKGESIGNLSDIDVIQADTVGVASEPRKSSGNLELEMSWYSALTHEARLYFNSSLYRNVSHVVGTSVAFCFIGYRVEVALRETVAPNDKELLTSIVFFWLEATFLSCFIIADFFILVLFPIYKSANKTERQLGLATIIDILIVGIVLGLFLVAETQRCCTKQSEGNSSGGLHQDDEISEGFLFESDCTCPRWGTRIYGNLGMIEPFTSLIFLRLFRFQIGHLLIKNFKKDVGDAVNHMESNPSTQYQTNHTDDNGQSLSGHNNAHKSKYRSALQLWECAIADFPDIVQKHGQFSGELLQAMLGLEIATESPGVSKSAELDKLATKTNQTQDLSKHEGVKSHIKLAQTRYAKLPPRAQGIVIAGSLQKPVKPIYPQVCNNTQTKPSLVSPQRTGLVNFEIDTEQICSEQNTSYPFVAPFARLVRSMRRCDRRHLPLLKGWISVDVVMTQFEIVYFEAIDSYYSDLDEQTRLHCEACRLALKATKGGKNLRLCDVALGRKVVGHLDFADVTEVHVAKDDVPLSDMALVEKAAVLFNGHDDLDVEHWSNLYSETEGNQKYARIIRWTLIQEERLMISTNSGTLYFRFYSDLAYFEHENQELLKNPHGITRDIAFQWAETISRICGRSQLQQNLPHFGEENEAELRDYLKVVHFHEKEAENERRNIARGVHNVGNVELLFVGTEECGSAKTKAKHKRIKSMVDLSSAEMDTTVKVSPLQEDGFSLKQKHRTIKSATEFIDTIGMELNSADDQV